MPRSGRSSRTLGAAAGVLLRDKPAGATSHDVVAAVRRERGVKAGHAGTLDPFATGLLLVLLGRATRLQRYMLFLPKVYRAVARLGWRSTTGDPDGELEHTGRLPGRLELPVGRIEQQVPMTSAVKVGGERLYRRAHRGEKIETPVRTVNVHRAVLVSTDGDGGRAEFEIECSSGTYVRSLIETLGDAYCERLRRTAIGPFRVEDAGEEPIGLTRALAFLPERALSAAETERVGHGVPVPAGNAGEGAVRMTHDGAVVAVGIRRDDLIKPEVVLMESS